ncbi:MAG: DUF1572 family protein [Planctomycetaceae bacterium]|jgi:hypothetical protein
MGSQSEQTVARYYLRSTRDTFLSHKEAADRAIAQVSDAGLRRALDEHTNSIAIIMRHIAGNLTSRWTDFRTTDGEKPWRDRDGEFLEQHEPREQLLARWNAGWQVVLDALDNLQTQELGLTIYTRGEAQTVLLALQRSLAHVAYHCGQIVLLARVFAEGEWQILSIPRGGSAEYNARNWGTGTPRPPRGAG